jgi:hypothetical protein
MLVANARPRKRPIRSVPSRGCDASVNQVRYCAQSRTTLRRVDRCTRFGSEADHSALSRP